jgi:hypothetical protein
MWSVSQLCKEVPKIVERGVQKISVQITRTRIEHVLSDV